MVDKKIKKAYERVRILKNNFYRKNQKIGKRGQEEIVGFALIIIVIAIILLIFLSISIRSPKEGVESYEVRNFIQSFLQHTTDCRRSDNLDFLSVQRLIFECYDENKCLDDRLACNALNTTLTELINTSWKTGEHLPIKGTKLEIFDDRGEDIFFVENGNITLNSKGSSQEFYRSTGSIEIFFTVYY